MKDKELRKAIKLGIRTLIIQEVRFLRLERSFTPYIILDEMSRSIEETKRTIVKMVRFIEHKERSSLLKRMIHQTVNEEIDRAIELRKTKCVRCLHGRFYDRAGTAFKGLPVKTRAETIGCDKLRPNLRKSCLRFVEVEKSSPMDDYLNEMTLLYEFREWIGGIEEIWKGYLIK